MGFKDLPGSLSNKNKNQSNQTTTTKTVPASTERLPKQESLTTTKK
ncbi:MAG TPA: hypothetical protein PKA28_09675 [Methylomusa anaerophila]|uniref:Uncharacterized protein n=1 Tax=Methylomusa anaerophila TaxID=1930071 RepID=A0A348AHZ0_9FIRM|nr:hypothetical protein [Methylomusa anaerophila]BBB90688.1 hypothetical protein MAMMFC1_01349 [Methylomusa anaerophila]HML88708.1 hypothetical protein [Methylomusa anaerophila]